MPLTPFVFIFGLLIGSFLNVCIYRIPRNASLVLPSSMCPSCNAPIRPWDNVPIISYILLGGKCRHCGSRISVRYPVVELLNGLFYLAVFWRFGLSWSSLVYSFFVSSLIVITLIDLEFQIIPDRITLPGIFLGLLAGSFLLPDPFFREVPLGWESSLIGAAAGFGFFYSMAYLSIVILKKEGMGGGDIKMMAMVGGFLGWKTVILTTFLGSLAGSVVGITMMLLKGRRQGLQIPFGPYLALGAVVSIFFGQEILKWYLHNPQ